MSHIAKTFEKIIMNRIGRKIRDRTKSNMDSDLEGAMENLSLRIIS